MIRPVSKHDRSVVPPPQDAFVATVPDWLRAAIGRTEREADAGFLAGAALGALDAVIRAKNPSAGAWRHRLALSAAAVTCRHVGRTEDEAALRDAACLTRPGDDAGPAGRILEAWRMLAGQPVRQLLAKSGLATMLTGFGFNADAHVSEIAVLASNACSGRASAVTAAAQAGIAVASRYPDMARSVAPWLADAVLARKLVWEHAVPLSAAHRFATLASGSESPVASLAAYHVRAALGAIDLAASLERRAQKLLAVAPSLRAKGAYAVVEGILATDAIMASQSFPSISDRGLRRLCDRLVSLGAVRELTGRSTFRLYGL